MVFLGINAGLGQSDCACLPLPALNLESGWLDYPRPKTGIDRRCPLWPETVQALQETVEKRPQPKDDADADLVFVTKYGKRWVRLSDHENVEDKAATDTVAQEFRKLTNKLGIDGARNFYAIRHMFRTVTDASKDQPAIDHVMGHARDDMASVYRESIDDDRLQAVVAVVHNWLFE
jgi:integrase